MELINKLPDCAHQQHVCLQITFQICQVTCKALLILVDINNQFCLASKAQDFLFCFVSSVFPVSVNNLVICQIKAEQRRLAGQRVPRQLSLVKPTFQRKGLNSRDTDSLERLRLLCF